MSAGERNGCGHDTSPKIEAAAKEGNHEAVIFPRAKVEGSEYDFSFSGLKSAVLNHINHEKMANRSIIREDIAACFQDAVVDALCERIALALDEYGADVFALAGGVASNMALRSAAKGVCEKRGVKFVCPSPKLCTDNAAMIGAAAYISFTKGEFAGWDLNAVPQLTLKVSSMDADCRACTGN